MEDKWPVEVFQTASISNDQFTSFFLTNFIDFVAFFWKQKPKLQTKKEKKIEQNVRIICLIRVCWCWCTSNRFRLFVSSRLFFFFFCMVRLKQIILLAALCDSRCVSVCMCLFLKCYFNEMSLYLKLCSCNLFSPINSVCRQHPTYLIWKRNALLIFIVNELRIEFSLQSRQRENIPVLIRHSITTFVHHLILAICLTVECVEECTRDIKKETEILPHFCFYESNLFELNMPTKKKYERIEIKKKLHQTK